MKLMTKLENIIITRTGCNRETANLVANDVFNEIEKESIAEFVEKLQRRTSCFHRVGGHSTYEAVTLYDINNLAKDYGL